MDYPYTIKKHKRAKSIKITIHPDATVHVTIPHRLPKIFAHRFVKQNTAWINEKIKQIQKSPRITLKGTDTEYKKCKEIARMLVHARLELFNKHYDFKYNAVRIKNTIRTWGSCSRHGNLNFNYKIALIPPEMSDYIIVHELCHLKEFNHSKRFWGLVEQTIPNYTKIRKTIKNGVYLQ